MKDKLDHRSSLIETLTLIDQRIEAIDEDIERHQRHISNYSERVDVLVDKVYRAKNSSQKKHTYKMELANLRGQRNAARTMLKEVRGRMVRLKEARQQYINERRKLTAEQIDLEDTIRRMMR